MYKPQEKFVDDDENLMDIGTRIDDNIKTLTQSAVSEMTKEDFEQQQLGSLLARAGAKVYSVEGESWQEGLNSVEGVSFLGHFIKADEFIDGFRIWFTKKGGYFYKGSRKVMPKNRRIPHPLSMKGYYVPRDGGLLVYDNGYTLLLSKSGIFTGRGGWGQVRAFREKWIKKEVENQSLQDRLQHTTSQLNHTEAQLMRVSVSKDDIVIWGMKVQDQFHNARDTLTYMRGSVISLHSQIEGIQSIKGHQEQLIKRTISDIKKQIDDLQQFVMNERMFDAIAMAGSQAPDIKDALKKKLKDGWRREGIIPEDKQEKEIQALKQKMEQQDKEMQDMKDKLLRDTAGRPPIQPPTVQQQQLAQQRPRAPPPKQDKEPEDEGSDGEGTEDQSKPQPPLHPDDKNPKQQVIVTDEQPKGVKEKLRAIGQEITNAGKKSTQRPRGDDEQPEQGEPKDEGAEDTGDEEESDESEEGDEEEEEQEE